MQKIPHERIDPRQLELEQTKLWHDCDRKSSKTQGRASQDAGIGMCPPVEVRNKGFGGIEACHCLMISVFFRDMYRCIRNRPLVETVVCISEAVCFYRIVWFNMSVMAPSN